MYTHSHVGHARFGKIDGFELLAFEGALRAFASPSGREVLSHALQLRQEEIRPFPGSEILSINMLEFEGHTYHLITLYRYALDRYKRDGYRAVTLALKDYWAHPGRLIQQLMHLQTLDKSHSSPERVFQPGISPQLSNQPPQLRPGKAVFIPMTTGKVGEMEVLLNAWPTDLSVSYGRVYASVSSEVTEQLDPAHMVILSHNPYCEQVQETEGGIQESIAASDSTFSVPQNSLVNAYAQEGEDYWQKKSSMEKKAKPEKRPNRDGYWLWPGVIVVLIGLTGLVIWSI